MNQQNQGQGKSHMRRRDSQSRPESDQQIGGREFGQVVEPMQAQMASGNEGLTDKTAHQETDKTQKKGRKVA